MTPKARTPMGRRERGDAARPEREGEIDVERRCTFDWPQINIQFPDQMKRLLINQRQN